MEDSMKIPLKEKLEIKSTCDNNLVTRHIPLGKLKKKIFKKIEKEN